MGLNGSLEIQLVETTSMGSLDDIPAAHEDVLQNVTEIGDERLDSSTGCLGNGKGSEEEIIMVEEVSFKSRRH